MDKNIKMKRILKIGKKFQKIQHMNLAFLIPIWFYHRITYPLKLHQIYDKIEEEFKMLNMHQNDTCNDCKICKLNQNPMH